MSRKSKVHCRIKAVQWSNSFETREQAEADAREREQVEGRPFHAYRCPFCRRYHSGTDIGRRMRRATK